MGRSGRKTLSINGALYVRFQARCAALDLSVSSAVEKLVADITGGPQVRERLPPRPPRMRPRPNPDLALATSSPPHGTRYHYVHGKCRCAACRAANSAYANGKYHNNQAIEISDEMHSLLRDRVVREMELRGVLTTPSLVAEGAINRMLDQLEQYGMGAEP